MKRQHWGVAAIITLTLGALFVAVGLFMTKPVVLEPSGAIAGQQRDIFYVALGIMSLVALPVFVLLGVFAWRYRATNTTACYTPNWDTNRRLELLWWGIPLIIVVVLSVVAWRTAHSLDPYRPLVSSTPPVTVQVVALRWKWLFIYPEQAVASVNQLTIPVDTPINFEIAADAPMNSLWIPELGGQIYAMNGMNTKLHLIADREGDFRGMSSNISGKGFADMTFRVSAVSPTAFASWTASHRHHASGMSLTLPLYEQLALPSIMPEPQYYHLHDVALYQHIIDKYDMSHSQLMMSHHMEEN